MCVGVVVVLDEFQTNVVESSAARKLPYLSFIGAHVFIGRSYQSPLDLGAAAFVLQSAQSACRPEIRALDSTESTLFLGTASTQVFESL